MDENTWRFAQLMMWVIGIQTAFITGLMGFVWNNLSKRIDEMEDKISKLETYMVEIKTILRMKECCMINDERQIKKVE